MFVPTISLAYAENTINIPSSNVSITLDGLIDPEEWVDATHIDFNSSNNGKSAIAKTNVNQGRSKSKK